ncbi:Nmad2 family putative nucleotide modification protein [Chitinophaga sancti]|uniref:Nucleotide modification associated domain-containing protein n=1 Tax=Chitinophaga sancti TaxID=1004 RepID=A0A1K1LLG3_9BACT|nr:hypothetical protein [Chitinophaga sancti]WQD65049.1 hypothetical protein U0033_11650 [Chitinophaga sancti]WQG89327.1 hypothetical protein SR876_30820 [Chitinophaga sancti]SFW11732.1 hypothetical protein SAMN05661012_00007 [Chitinophaga sancti]
MAYFSYKIEHDFGLAPNPFGSYCTLAVCKPSIRNNKNLQLGDWIIGTGSVKLKKLHHLIFAMQVEEKIEMEKYWDDPRFQYKKPVINGSLVQMYGDNFYYRDPTTKKWNQINGAHSLEGGRINKEHLKVDTGGRYVLISKTFFYFGDKAIQIPKRFWPVCSEGRNMKGPSIPKNLADKFIEWVKEKHTIGIHGDPINWKQYFNSKKA